MGRGPGIGSFVGLDQKTMYPKLERLVPPADADAFVDWLSRSAKLAVDPGELPRVRSDDPDDDYVIALTAAERALLVSGDVHLTSLANRVPVRTPRRFISELGEL